MRRHAGHHGRVRGLRGPVLASSSHDDGSCVVIDAGAGVTDDVLALVARARAASGGGAGHARPRRPHVGRRPAVRGARRAGRPARRRRLPARRPVRHARAARLGGAPAHDPSGPLAQALAATGIDPTALRGTRSASSRSGRSATSARPTRCSSSAACASSPGTRPVTRRGRRSTCVGPLAFTGDVLFAGSVGRTDLPGGDDATMQRTLREVVATLPPETVVVPGHGPTSDIATELGAQPVPRAADRGPTRARVWKDRAPWHDRPPCPDSPSGCPTGRLVEQHVLDVLRRTFELHGFAGIETRAVEPLDQLLRKGETSKEVYVLRRLQEERRRGAGPRRQLGLHFDLTVPFARYVLENAGHLAFPFRRYQIQKVWRGERPQDGRFREFVQADIDVVGAGDAAVPLRGRAAARHGRGARRAAGDRRAAGAHPGEQPQGRRGLLPRARARRRRGRAAQHRQARQDRRRTTVAALLVAEAGAPTSQARACLALAAISGSDEAVDRPRSARSPRGRA